MCRLHIFCIKWIFLNYIVFSILLLLYYKIVQSQKCRKSIETVREEARYYINIISDRNVYYCNE